MASSIRRGELYTLEQICEIWKLPKRAKLVDLIKSGVIPREKVGEVYVTSGDALWAYFAPKLSGENPEVNTSSDGEKPAVNGAKKAQVADRAGEGSRPR